MNEKLCDAIDGLMPSLTDLFTAIAVRSHDGVGISRDAYGAVETATGDILIDYARARGLDARYDRVGNVNVTRKGQFDKPPEILIGSHIDSVPRGGNYDGLAGVIAGIGALAALEHGGGAGTGGVRVLGFRGEESPWFGTAYLGSKLLMGAIGREEAERLKRFDTGKTLVQHLEAVGADISQLGRAAIHLDRVKAYLELHIEQGPHLESIDKPLAAVTAVRGNIRYPFATCEGRYAHSAGVPRHLRADALMATVKLIAYCDELWSREIEAGHDDLVFTCGILQTNSAEHSMTKVPGEVAFSFNVGGVSDAAMERFHAAAMDKAHALAQEHHVRFDFGSRVGTNAVDLNKDIVELLRWVGREAGIDVQRMPSVGHDAAMFARRGIPTGIILVRNANGSHNPDEHMEMTDFAVGLKLLTMSTARIAAQNG
jgi:beta-ureidopropionase / N-carbamoyl-L-amino-acid hydrolase